MATLEESPPQPPPPPPLTSNAYYSIEKSMKTLQQTNPWIEQFLQQAQIALIQAQKTLDSAILATHPRISQIRSTSSAHLHQTFESLEDLKAQFHAYETKFFGKVKEGAVVAVSYPLISAGAAVGLGILALKGPRRFLYYKTLRLFFSEEAMISRADAKVKELRQSYERMKAEFEKLEKRASHAEEEMKRGRTKLRYAGNQIRKAVNSAVKIEKQARGLKDVFADLPKSEASLFRSQVSNLVTEAKRERSALSKQVTKISNYGISV